jgi:eukaryotic-like serine/threonine-protein kinase
MEYPELQALEGKYEVLGKIREGGMGALYKVRHRHLDQIQVVKVMRPWTADSVEVGKRFLREAQMATRLHHPNVVSFYDYFVDEADRAFIVMEFIDGPNLRDVIRERGPMPVPLVLDLAEQCLSALAYLHKKGIVHRDISPDNIMLTPDEEGGPHFKLIDLGIAKMTDAEENLTAAGVFMGKLRYSSPEQLENETSSGAIDGRSDLYSFGAVLYEALTGTCPFQGESLHSLLDAHFRGITVPFEESDPAGHVGPTLRAGILRSLEVDAGRRFPTADEFRTSLRALPEAEVPSAGYSAASSYLETTLGTSAQRFIKKPPGEKPRVQERHGPSWERPPPSVSRSTPQHEPSEETPTVAFPAARAGSSATGSRSGAEVLERAARVSESAGPSGVPRERTRRRVFVGILLVTAAVAAVATGLWRHQRTPREGPLAAPVPAPLPSIPAPPTPTVPEQNPLVSPEKPASPSETPPLMPTVLPSMAALPRPQLVARGSTPFKRAEHGAPTVLAETPKLTFCPLVERTSYEQGVVKEKPKGFSSDEPEAYRAPRTDSARMSIEVTVQPERPLEAEPFNITARFVNGGDIGVVVARIEESAVREAGGFRPVTTTALPIEVEVGGALEIYRYQGILTARSGFLKELRVTDDRKDSWKTLIRLVPCAAQ